MIEQNLQNSTQSTNTSLLDMDQQYIQRFIKRHVSAEHEVKGILQATLIFFEFENDASLKQNIRKSRLCQIAFELIQAKLKLSKASSSSNSEETNIQVQPNFANEREMERRIAQSVSALQLSYQ